MQSFVSNKNAFLKNLAIRIVIIIETELQWKLKLYDI